jgi:hypothetical protein
VQNVRAENVLRAANSEPALSDQEWGSCSMHSVITLRYRILGLRDDGNHADEQIDGIVCVHQAGVSLCLWLDNDGAGDDDDTVEDLEYKASASAPSPKRAKANDGSTRRTDTATASSASASTSISRATRTSTGLYILPSRSADGTSLCDRPVCA